MPAAADKSLIVSLHDAHPGSHAAIEEQIRFLAGYGVTKTSILVVPDFHHEGPVTTSRPFCEAVSGWQAAGHEIVLHGYFHDRKDSPRESLRTLFWTRLYTNREAEFLDLPNDEARVRLRRGRELFAAQGWNVRGFIAPAWLMSRDLLPLLEELGFAYTNRLRDIIRFERGVRHAPIATQSLCYSTRAGWRRFASAIWNKRLFGKLRETNVVRLSLHPRDLEFKLMRRQIDQILRSSFRRGFQPTTYAEYVAR